MEQSNIKKTRILGFIIAVVVTLILGIWGGILISGNSISDIIQGMKEKILNSENTANVSNINNNTENNTSENKAISEKQYTQDELEQMALNYYEALTGYRPSMVSSIINEDGTLSIQMYDLVEDHNSTSDWYTVDMKTAEGTNILQEKIDLKLKPNKNQKTVTRVNYEKINTDDAKYYMTVTGLDNQENTVWTYTTSTDYVAQVDLLEFLEVKDDLVYINEHAKIVALDKQTGNVIWENNDYEGGGSSNFKFDEDGFLYLSGSMSPDLLVIDSNGKTVRKIKQISEDMFWPMDLSLEDAYVKITFPVAGFSGEEDYNYVYLEVDDIKNSDNKVLSKEIVPEFLHTQITGFEDIKSFELDSDGDVFIKFEPDSELAKKYGDQDGKYKAAVGAKNIYALFSGNGGYGSFVIVKLDGTMYTLSSYDLSETGIIEIKDTQVNNVDYVIAVQGFDAFYFDIVDKNGNVKMY